jgi:hypothetical protein
VPEFNPEEPMRWALKGFVDSAGHLSIDPGVFTVLHVLLWVQQGAGRTGGWRNQLTSITGAC